MAIDWLAFEQKAQALVAELTAQTATPYDDLTVQFLGNALAEWLKHQAVPQPHLMMAAAPMSNKDLAEQLKARGIVVTPWILSLLQMFGPTIIQWILSQFGPKPTPPAPATP